MNNDVAFAEEQIVNYFRQYNSSVGDKLFPQEIISLQNGIKDFSKTIWSQRQKDATPEALENLCVRGFITDNLRLTQKGYDELHKPDRITLIKQLLKAYENNNSKYIKPENYGIDTEEYWQLIKDMQDDELIRGAKITYGSNIIHMAFTDNIRITTKGSEYLNGGYSQMGSHSIINNINNSTISGSQIGSIDSEFSGNTAEISDQIEKAISKIKEIPTNELQSENKEQITDLLSQLKNSLVEESLDIFKEKQTLLKGLLMGIGKMAVESIKSAILDIPQVAAIMGI
jgi:hypothetical protein